jgi:type I restriction enzyme S subunit
MNLHKPETWQTTKLSELVIYVLGGDWGKDADFESPDYTTALCIRGAEFRYWNEDKGSSASPRKIKNSSLANRILKDGDILVEISGGGPDQPVGRTVLIDKAALSHAPDIPKICTNFVRLLRTSGDIDSRFINSYLSFFYASGEIRDYQAGSNNLRNLKFNDYLGIDIPIPPLNEQHRIVAKIEEMFSELDKGIENLKTARAQLKVYRQALLKHAFEGKLTAQWRADNQGKLENSEALLKRIQQERAQRYQQQLAEWEATGGSKPKAPKLLVPLTAEELAELPELPEGWGWCKLGDFIDSIDAGKSFKCDEREPRANEIGVAKVSAVTWGEYDESESKTCTDTSKENEAYLIRSGDFILSRANTIDLVGACVIARKVTKKIMLSDKTLRISFDGLSQEYFLQYLGSRIGRKQIMRLSTGNQESMRNIGQDRIRSIAVPICSGVEADAVIESLAARISEVDQLELTITTSLQQAEALRQSILKRAFSGQLVPQNPHDEPAIELLARIKAERSNSSNIKSKQAKQ